MPTPQTQVEALSEGIDVEADLNDRDSQGAHPRRATRPQSISELPANSQRLVVTSQLHPFWSTKKGIALGVLVVMGVVGGIVGGVLGNKSNDEPARNPGSAPPPPKTSSTTSMVQSLESTSFEVSTTPNDTPIITAAEVIPSSVIFSSTSFPSLPNPPGRNVLRYTGRILLS